jgi:hypothetical protein
MMAAVVLACNLIGDHNSARIYYHQADYPHIFSEKIVSALDLHAPP